MDAYLETFDTAGGPITIAVDPAGALLRLSFGDGHYTRTIEEDLLASGYQVHPAAGQAARARQEIEEYWSEGRRTFEVPVALQGTQWQIDVWQALMAVPYGTTRTYGSMAAQLGRPHAARAIGRANATNPIPLVIPCHRLVGANGSLTGFGGGLHIKQRLLEHEGAIVDDSR
jgi:methylated-DNA-[protein]-cysteine S-methyltransferase